jgi:pimeloyl-ACP methyl ester carboxylesterase
MKALAFTCAALLLSVTASAEYASINGLRMYYEIHGDAGGVPLVLLHGGGSTIETTFGRVLPIFAKTRKVIAFEQQGHGRTSDIADRPFTFEQSADDAAALLHHLGIEKADFFGYSNGGSIAMQIAVRHPKVVRKLVVESAMYRFDGLLPGLREGLKNAKPEDMPAELREAYLAVAPHPENLASFSAKCAQRMLDFKDWSPDTLRGIDAPVLIMIGDTDVVRPEHAVEMYRLFPQAQLAILPGTDHMAIVQRTDWQVSMIEAFLGR